jgi:hypothetical protein
VTEMPVEPEPQAEPQAEPETQAAEPYVDPYKTVYNPLELPANTAAAQAFMAAHPDDVDPAAPMSPERTAQATEAIQAHQEAMRETVAGVGSDPRLEETGAE